MIKTWIIFLRSIIAAISNFFPKQTKREATQYSETLRESKPIELKLNSLNPLNLISFAQTDRILRGIRNSSKELKRIPRKEFKNANPANEQKLDVLPIHLWIEIFAVFLSVKDCCTAMIACKFLGEITNANNIRENFFLSKTLNTRYLPRLFNELEKKEEAPFILRDLLTTLNTSMSQYSLNRLTLLEKQPSLEQPGDQGYILRGKPR